MKPLLSIIVPIYKVEPYLRACLDSILRQNFTDYELILVNDGSPDNCGKICDEYASTDSRIIVIHKDNEGQSSARNAGLDIASGKYITFVDSDDELGNEYTYAKNIEILLSNANIDILQYPHYNCCNTQCTSIDPITNEYINKKENILYFWATGKDKIGHSICNKIFKRQIFNKIRFPFGKYFEDAFIISHLIKEIDTIYISNVGSYKYNFRSDSTLHSDFSVKKQIDCFDAFVEIYNSLKNYNEIYLSSIKVHTFMRILNIYLHMTPHIDKIHTKICRKKIPIQFIYLKNLFFSNSTLYTKIRLLLLILLGIKSYEFIWKFIFKLKTRLQQRSATLDTTPPSRKKA